LLIKVAVKEMFCANVMLCSTLLRNYTDESNFQTLEFQGPHVKSNETFSLQIYCSVNNVILEAVQNEEPYELCPSTNRTLRIWMMKSRTMWREGLCYQQGKKEKWIKNF